MPEVRFYHLTQVPLERALPTMLERTLERGQKAVVRGTHPDRLRFLDGQLWTANEAGFLPHGIDGDPDPDRHPVWLTTYPETPNKPDVLFLIDGAQVTLPEVTEMATTAILFDGHDPAAVETARSQWRSITVAGLAAVYWAQGQGGKWEKRHEAKAE